MVLSHYFLNYPIKGKKNHVFKKTDVVVLIKKNKEDLTWQENLRYTRMQEANTGSG